MFLWIIVIPMNLVILQLWNYLVNEVLKRVVIAAMILH